MATKRPEETRHRWTPEERRRLVELSRPFSTITGAAEAVYVEMSMPLNAVRAQLYELYLKGQAPHLSVTREERGELSPAVVRAVRELARAMRVDGISDALVTVDGESIHLQVVRRAQTFDLDF